MKDFVGLNKVYIDGKDIKSTMGVDVDYWYWKSDVLDFDKKATVDFLLQKEKEIIESYPPGEDGGTDLPDSLTSRYSNYNFFKIDDPLTNKIQDHIKDNIKQCITTFNGFNKNIPTDDLWLLCWYNVLRKGEKINIHAHRFINQLEKSFMSGHFTVQAENTNTNYLTICKSSNWSVKNIPGQLIIFPTYVPHYTDITNSEETRISIAFDLYDNKQLANENFIEKGNCIKLQLD